MKKIRQILKEETSDPFSGVPNDILFDLLQDFEGEYNESKARQFCKYLSINTWTENTSFFDELINFGKKNLKIWMKNIVIFEVTLITGNRYFADLESLSLINDNFVVLFIGMLKSRYIANQGLGSLSSWASRSSDMFSFIINF